jgi:hypothetical protein
MIVAIVVAVVVVVVEVIVLLVGVMVEFVALSVGVVVSVMVGVPTLCAMQYVLRFQMSVNADGLQRKLPGPFAAGPLGSFLLVVQVIVTHRRFLL